MNSRLVAAATTAILISMSLAGTAFGHATLLSSDPPDGGTLTTTPYTLAATFDEELTPDGSSIVIEGPSGAQVATGTVSADDGHAMTAELPILAPGQYTVRWTAVTADDLAVERGTFVFTVAAPAASGTAAPTAAPTAPPASSPAGSGNDVLIALLLAAVGIGAVLVFVFLRGRR